MKILLLQGLPASGKSTYAHKLITQSNNKVKVWKRVNRDLLREMIDGGVHSQTKEKHIRAIELSIAQHFLDAGYNVVVDDTNLSPSAQKMWKDFAEKNGATLETKLFITAPEECIQRDLMRPKSVGAKVIMRMYNERLRPPAEIYKAPKDKPEAIICDIDGTLAHMTEEGRLKFGKKAPFVWDKVGEDALDPAVAGLLRKYAQRDLKDENPVRIILLSGRDSVCRPETEEWLSKHSVPYDDLYMRPENDNRKDSMVKRELFEKHIKNKYRILFVLDDRNQVVKQWRNMGLKVFQVAEGDF